MDRRLRYRQCGFLAFAFALAFCSIAYELILAKAIAEVAGDATLWEAVTISVFLMGLGLRSLAFEPQAGPLLRRTLVRTEAAILVLATFAALAVLGLETLYRIYVYDDGLLREMWPFPPVYLLGGSAQLLSFGLGWLSGFEIQFFLHDERAPAFERRTATVLAIYHLGGLAGTLAFIASLPLPPTSAMAGVSAFNLVALVGWLGATRATPAAWRLAGGAGLALAALAAVAPPLTRLALKNHYHNIFRWESDRDGLSVVEHPAGVLDLMKHLSAFPDIRRYRTPYQTIDIIPPSEAGNPSWSMFINGRFQIDTATSAAYHEQLVHPAIAAAGRVPAKVLILGGGDGALAYELTKYGDAIDKVTMVDIDAVVLDLARSEPFLVELNGNVMSWPRLDVEVGDAWRFLRATKETFDAVFIDLTYPYEFDSARFYSLEFLRLVEKRLSADGFLALGSPFDLASAQDSVWRRSLYTTASAAGFPHQLAYSGRADHYFMAGKGALSAAPRMRQDLPLKALRAGPLAMRWRALSGPVQAKDINSVLQPRFLGVGDAFF
jgi:spermidine synthase